MPVPKRPPLNSGFREPADEPVYVHSTDMITNRPKRISLAVILSSATLTIMAGGILAPVLNLMREGLGVDPSSVGLIITTHGLFMALSSPLMGSIIDRKGVRRTYIVALMGYGLAGGAGLLIDSYWLLLASRACLGIALAGVFASINVLILNTYEGERRNRVMGWRGSAQSVGGILWPLIGGALGVISWHLPFAVYMAAIPIGLLAVSAVPEPAIRGEDGTGADDGRSVFGIFRARPVLFLIYGLIFSASVLLYAIVIYLPQLLETFGITSTIHIGLFITLMPTFGGVSSFFYGRIRSRLSYRAIVIISVSLWLAAFTILSGASGSGLVATAMALFGLAQGLIMPTVMVWIGDVVPPSFRGRFSSYLGTFGFIGQFLSAILFAPVLVLAGLRAVFPMGAAIAAAWFLLVLFGPRGRR
jgi:ACDE family multidrug resistance protein